ncbi:MAG: DNA polymerase III subunit delta [Planctomycetota bacterium]
MAKRTSSTKSAAASGPSPDHPVVILHGRESFLRSLHLEKLREALEERGEPVDTITFDGNSAAVAEVLDECRSLGLMGQHKLVIVDAADEFLKKGDGDTAHRRLLERYAESPEAGANLVLVSDNKLVGNIVKTVQKIGSVTDCATPKPEQAAGWLLNRATKLEGITLDRRAAAALVDRLGPSLGRLASELDKLAAVAEGRGESTIDQALVDELVGLSREEQAWSLQQPLLSGHAQPALMVLDELLTVSRQPTVLIRFAMTDLARKLHAAAQGLRQGENPGTLAKSLRLWGPAQRSIMSVAGRVDPGALASLLSECVEADFRGKTSQGDERRSLEALTVRFASVCRS